MAIRSGRSMAEITQMAVLPVVLLISHLESRRLSPGCTGLAEVLGRSPFSVTAVVTDTFVADQPGQGNDPAGSMPNSLKILLNWIKFELPLLFKRGLGLRSKSRVPNCVFTMVPKYYPQGRIQIMHGTIHKWRHANMTQNWSPLCHAMYYVLCICVTKSITHLPLFAWRHSWIVSGR